MYPARFFPIGNGKECNNDYIFPVLDLETAHLYPTINEVVSSWHNTDRGFIMINNLHSMIDSEFLYRSRWRIQIIRKKGVG